MKFWISNTNDRNANGGYGPTTTLHTSDRCMTLHGKNRRPWEATLSEIADAATLCGVCAPLDTGN